MTAPSPVRCAIYTRKSSEEGLEQSFNSLDAQREACEAYVRSQRHEGWESISANYDDGGFSGGNMARPALKRLLDDIAAKRVDTVVVYKVDRLTRSLADFAKIVEQFDQQGITFVSVTQQFNTTTSMGRLTLNVLLSFAQFEREVTGERIRDKIAASKRKGMWMGGRIPLGYDLQDRRLIVNHGEAVVVNEIFEGYLREGCVSNLQVYLDQKGIRSKRRLSKTGHAAGGNAFSRGSLYAMLQNRIYRGEIAHKENIYLGQHAAIIGQDLWKRVKTQLATNLQGERKQSRPTQQSVLTGLVYDSKGNRFTPSHANKKGRRYRYYVSQALAKEWGKKNSGSVRLPAKPLEDLVLAQLSSLFRSRQRLAEIFTRAGATTEEKRQVIEAIAVSAGKTDHRVVSTIQRVVVHDERIEILVNRAAMMTEVLGCEMCSHGGDDILLLQVDAQLTRYRGEVRFQLAPEIHGIIPHPIPSLIHAIARAHYWVDRIRRGESLSQRSLAAESGFNERYVSEIINLAFLAPDLIEAILAGTQALNISLDSNLLRLPPEWSQQRQHLPSAPSPKNTPSPAAATRSSARQ